MLLLCRHILISFIRTWCFFMLRFFEDTRTNQSYQICDLCEIHAFDLREMTLLARVKVYCPFECLNIYIKY